MSARVPLTFNTYPAEIENFYLRNPKILEVSIVGVPDPVMGEVPMAFVIPKVQKFKRKAAAIEKYGFTAP